MPFLWPLNTNTMSASNLHVYIGYTLVDITRTGVTRDSIGGELERNQHRNWETLIQCIGLRTQPHHINGPESYLVENISSLKFGDFYSGRPQQVWTWSWAVEPAGIYEVPPEPLGGLMQDFEQVPIIAGIIETARFMLPIFYPYGAIRNIYFERYLGKV